MLIFGVDEAADGFGDARPVVVDALLVFTVVDALFREPTGRPGRLAAVVIAVVRAEVRGVVARAMAVPFLLMVSCLERR